MTNTEIKRIYDRYLSDEISSNFKLDKGVLYKNPVKDILVGFCFERSSSEKESLYVWSFAMPLYIEKEDLSLTFGHRLRNKKNEELWHFKNNPKVDGVIKDLIALMQKEIKHFFPRVEKPNDFFEFYKNEKVKNIRIKEALTYSAVYAKRKESKELLEILTNELKNEDLDIGWIRGVLQNVTDLKEFLKKDNNVNTLLNKNIELTKSNLKIE